MGFLLSQIVRLLHYDEVKLLIGDRWVHDEVGTIEGLASGESGGQRIGRGGAALAG